MTANLPVEADDKSTEAYIKMLFCTGHVLKL